MATQGEQTGKAIADATKLNFCINNYNDKDAKDLQAIIIFAYEQNCSLLT